MTKKEYFDILRKIKNIENSYNYIKEDTDDHKYDAGYPDRFEDEKEERLDSLCAEVERLHLDKISINIAPKSEDEETRIYVVLGSEKEFPDVFEMRKDDFEDVTSLLYKVYTEYQSKEFYDEVGIELEQMVALILNLKGLPIYMATMGADTNNVRYWESNPYSRGLLDILEDDITKEDIEGPKTVGPEITPMNTLRDDRRIWTMDMHVNIGHMVKDMSFGYYEPDFINEALPLAIIAQRAKGINFDELEGLHTLFADYLPILTHAEKIEYIRISSEGEYFSLDEISDEESRRIVEEYIADGRATYAKLDDDVIDNLMDRLFPKKTIDHRHKI